MIPSQLPQPCGPVAFDTETTGLHIDDGARVTVVSIAFRDQDGKGHAYAFPFGQGPSDNLFDAPADLGGGEWAALCGWLGRQRLVAHNAKFDLLVMGAGTVGGYPGCVLDPNLCWDTMLGQWVLEPLEKLGLKDTAARLWGADEQAEQQALKPYLKGGGGYDRVPWEVMRPYALQDAKLTYRLFERQAEMVDTTEGHFAHVIEREVEVCKVLTGMERRGIGYDVEGSLQAAKLASTQVERLRAQLPFTATPQGARDWFYMRQMCVPHCPPTKTGLSPVSECCIREYARQGVQGAAEWQAWKKAFHAVGKYYKGFADRCGPDGRLRTDFRQTGTINGRFSSHRVNLQALPHDYRLEEIDESVPRPRSLFRPAPGHQLWELDLGQAELRVATSLSKCVGMREVLEAGEDPHGVTAERIFGDRDHQHRQVAKRCNFGLLYNIGPDTFRKDLDKQTGVRLTLNEAKDLINAWRGLYPEFPVINRKAEMAVRTRGFLRLPGGRLRMWLPGEDYSKAFNALVQGSIAEFMKMLMVEVDQLVPDTMLLQIHDSITLELPEGVAPAWVEKVIERGEQMATELFGIRMTMDAKQWG